MDDITSNRTGADRVKENRYTLLATLQLMDDTGSAVMYDPGTSCHVRRDEDGNIELTCDRGPDQVVRTLKSLIENECHGLRGAALCARIAEVMRQPVQETSDV
jgi:hypothetical protein